MDSHPKPVMDISLNDIDQYEPFVETNTPKESYKTFDDYFDILSTKMMNMFYGVALNGVLLYGTFMYYSQVGFNMLYDLDPMVANTIDYLSYLKTYSYGVMKNMKVEPFHTNWTSISYISYEYFERPKYNEMVISIESGLCSTIVVDSINDVLLFEKSKYMTHKTDDPLFITKFESSGSSLYYVSRQLPVKLDLTKYTQSKIRFISIVYTHPQMITQINLEIPNSWYVKHNELFSQEFVFRSLAYQAEEYVFDLNYKLLLLDNNMNYVELMHNQYVEIIDDDYRILTDA